MRRPPPCGKAVCICVGPPTLAITVDEARSAWEVLGLSCACRASSTLPDWWLLPDVHDCDCPVLHIQVLKDVLKLARRHEVGIDSSYAALVLGVCVIVGFATSLDNRINIMDAATACFLQHSLTGKASGRLY